MVGLVKTQTKKITFIPGAPSTRFHSQSASDSVMCCHPGEPSFHLTSLYGNFGNWRFLDWRIPKQIKTSNNSSPSNRYGKVEDHEDGGSVRSREWVGYDRRGDGGVRCLAHTNHSTEEQEEREVLEEDYGKDQNQEVIIFLIFVPRINVQKLLGLLK